MAVQRNLYKPKEKVQMVLEALTHPEGIGAYCRIKGIKDSQIYLWRNKIVEQADHIFELVPKKEKNQILRLEMSLKAKNEIIAELARENMTLKKTSGGLMI